MAERRPNILLITTDQQRYDALGINGNPVLRTPNLDAMAARGTNFRRCYTTCPVCIPARRTLLSGLHPDTHGMPGYRDGWDFDPPHTLPGVLSDAGYQTQLVGKLHLHPQRKRFGFDHMILSDSGNWRPNSPQQKENDYCDWFEQQGLPGRSSAHGINGNARTAKPWPLAEAYHHSSWVAHQAGEFFNQWRDPSAPSFAHVSFVAPHPPLVPPQAYWDRYIREPDLRPHIGEWAPPTRGETEPRGVVAEDFRGPYPQREIREAIAGYFGLINHIDDCVRYVIDQFFEYGNPRSQEPTWIVFSSDHGEMLGDHHMFRKSQAYEGSSHVPLLITGRNVEVPQGACDALVSWEDVMPTLIDLAGLDVPEGLDGRSLLPMMRGESEGVRDAIHGGCMDAAANQFVVSGDHKYIWFAATGEEQLFNLTSDPHERHDLSAEADDVLGRMRERMARRFAENNPFGYDPASTTPCGNRSPRAIWGGD